MEAKQATSDKTSDKSKRLIFADDLKESLLDYEAQGGHKYFREGANKILHEVMPYIIDACPSVDAAPVVHGHWIEHSHLEVGGECSVCGWQFQWFENAEARFCPHCGAKMDEEDPHG